MQSRSFMELNAFFHPESGRSVTSLLFNYRIPQQKCQEIDLEKKLSLYCQFVRQILYRRNRNIVVIQIVSGTWWVCSTEVLNKGIVEGINLCFVLFCLQVLEFQETALKKYIKNQINVETHSSLAMILPDRMLCIPSSGCLVIQIKQQSVSKELC